ncbi:MAG: hypothetical protein ACK5MH_09720 [Bacteroidales bacterium]
MAIDYVRVKKMIHTGFSQGEKFMARIFRNSDVSMEELCTEITQSTTVSYPDVLACLKALEINVSRHILAGRAVKFSLLGSFIPALKAKAMDTLEEVDASTIIKARCRFYPSPSFMSDLSKTSFNLRDIEVKGYQPINNEETPAP